MAAEGQSDKIVSDVEVCMKQKCGTEFLCVGEKKMAPIDIYSCLVNVYGDQTVDGEHNEVVGGTFQYW